MMMILSDHHSAVRRESLLHESIHNETQRIYAALLLQAMNSPRTRTNFYCLWSKLLCKLSSLSDLKSLPHAWHTNGWLILPRGLALSPLSVVGPMLDADIILITHVRALLNLSVSLVSRRKILFYDKIRYNIRFPRLYMFLWNDKIYVPS